MITNFFKSNGVVSIYILLYMWIFYINVDLEINKLVFGFLLNITQPNLNLLNGIMLIHPPILYLFYGIYILEYKIYIKGKTGVFLKKIKNRNLNKIFFGITIILHAVVLGAWWAEQELSWGGWWSWDFVELLSVNYLLYHLIFQHQTTTINLNIGSSILLKPTLLLLSVLSVRFNIINSIHNFINFESQNQYFYYIIIIIIITILLGVYVFKKKKLKNFTITNVFICFLFVFYLSFYLSIISLNVDPLINIKYIYMFITFIFVVFTTIFKKLYSSIYLIVFILSYSVYIGKLVNLLLLTIVLFICKKSKNTLKEISVNLLHSYLLLLLLISIHQIYNFLPFFKHLNQFDIHVININNFTLSSINLFYFYVDKKTNIDIGVGL